MEYPPTTRSEIFLWVSIIVIVIVIVG